MPCYDPREREPRVVYSDVPNGLIERLQAEITKLKEVDCKKSKLEAYLCAMFNELERRGIAESVVAEASRNGLVDLMGFWSSHRKQDRARLAKEIHKYSKDEQNIIREILNNDDTK